MYIKDYIVILCIVCVALLIFLFIKPIDLLDIKNVFG